MNFPSDWIPPGFASFCQGCGVNARFGGDTFRCHRCLSHLLGIAGGNGDEDRADRDATEKVVLARTELAERNRAAGLPPKFWMRKDVPE